MRIKLLILRSFLLVLTFTLSSCEFPSLATEATPGGDGGPQETQTETSEADGGPGQPGAPSNTDGAEVVLIAGGTFWMGSDDDDPQAEADEAPSHPVTLNAFYIYAHEVTQAMYAECVEAGACLPVDALASGPTSHFGDPAYADHPVTGVDWSMAYDYCHWAGGRLPTEAEWELAARSTGGFLYPWGEEEPTCDRANMLGCSDPPDTLAVGSLPEGNSAYEVADLSGNVWEWVHDWYDEDYYFFSPETNPLGPGTSEDELKVVRGGGLYSGPDRMRSVERLAADPYRPYDDVGFRCVAQPPLDLPAGYAPLDPGHLRIPPGPDDGGEHVEEFDPDPDAYFNLRGIVASCPIGDEIDLRFFISASSLVELTVSVDGDSFGSEYIPATDTYLCKGPLPDAYGRSGRITVVWQAEGEGISASGAWPVSLPSPDDCGSASSLPIEFEASAACPVDGYVELTFDTTVPFTWEFIRVVTLTDRIDIPCESPTPLRLVCTAPDLRIGGSIVIHLHGWTADGTERTYFGPVPLPAVCPLTRSLIGVMPMCFEDHPVVRVVTLPTSLRVESVSAEGTPLTCIGLAPGIRICGDLPGSPGSDITVSTCLEGEPACQDWSVTVPDCPAAPPEITYELYPGCLPGYGAIVAVRYSPSDLALISASADGATLTCESSPVPGQYMCHSLTAAPGSVVDFNFCLEDGRCYGDPVTVRDCTPGESHPSGWRVIGSCRDETTIAAIIDTGFDWLVPGGDFVFTVADSRHPFTCSVHPTIPGRIYCSTERTTTPGTLEVCVMREGWIMAICHHFYNWPDVVAGLEGCFADATPTPGPACSSYTDGASCTAAGCVWDKGPPERCYAP